MPGGRLENVQKGQSLLHVFGATTRERQRQGACPEQGGEREAADRKRGEIPGLGGGRSLGRRGFRRRGIRRPHLDRSLRERGGREARALVDLARSIARQDRGPGDLS